jgi:hypothetical protein
MWHAAIVGSQPRGTVGRTTGTPATASGGAGPPVPQHDDFQFFELHRPEPKANQLQNAQKGNVANADHGSSSKQRKGPFILRRLN